jgi:IS605 OrfB family transposase
MQTLVLKIKLRTLNRAKAARLAALADEFTACVRFHWEHIALLGTTNSTEIHRACYHQAKAQFRLPASTIQQARDKALAAYRSYRNRKKHDRRAQPTFRRSLPLRLAVENLKIIPDEGMIRISTPDGFLWLPIVIPACFADAVARSHAVSEVLRKGKDWYLMLAVKAEDVPSPQGERPRFGVDLGLANIAVLSGPGVVQFFSGQKLAFVRDRYFRYRQALQRKRKTGMVKRSKGRESRWMSTENHRISRAIVDIVAGAGGVLYVENLKGIRERCQATRKTRRMLHAWSFAQLLGFLRYKARLAGVEVIEVNPRKTSQTCSRCGHCARGNRPRQAGFHCQRCGYQVHADLNSTRVISVGGACFVDMGGVTPPSSGEAIGRKVDRGNRNLASSTEEAVAFRRRRTSLTRSYRGATGAGGMIWPNDTTSISRERGLPRHGRLDRALG